MPCYEDPDPNKEHRAVGRDSPRIRRPTHVIATIKEHRASMVTRADNPAREQSRRLRQVLLPSVVLSPTRASRVHMIASWDSCDSHVFEYDLTL